MKSAALAVLAILTALSLTACLHWPKEPAQEIPERAKTRTVPAPH